MGVLVNIRFDENGLHDLASEKVWTQWGTVRFDTEGLFGGKCAYSAKNGYFASEPDERLVLGTNDFTVSFWVKPLTDAGNGAMGVFTNVGGSYGDSFHTSIAGRKSDITFSNYKTGNGDFGWFAFPALSLNEWHHIAFTRKDGIFYLFADGVLQDFKEDMREVNWQFGASTQALLTGCYGNNLNYYPLNGYLDDFVILDYALWTEDFDVPENYLVDGVVNPGPTPTKKYTVTEKYQDDTGMELQPDTTQVLEEGDTYTKTAPEITDYEYQAYKINDGLLQEGDTALVKNINADLTVTFIYKFIEAEPEKFTITEKYQDEEGSELQGDTTQTITVGEDYAKEPPNLAGYEYLGYRVADEALQLGSLVQIQAVSCNQTVIFVYRLLDPEPQPKEKYTVVEKYQDEDGEELKAETLQEIEEGEDYLQVAISLKGYEYLGYKIDGEELQKGSFVVINEVNQNHLVVFVYKKKVENGNGNDSGGNGNNNSNGNGTGNNSDSDGEDAGNCGCCAPVNIFNFYQCCCSGDDSTSSGTGDLIPNTNGRSWSVPVPANPLSDEVALSGYPLAMSIWNVARGCSFDGRYIWSAPLNGRIERIDPETAEIEVFEGTVEGQNISAQEMIFAADYLWTVASGNKFLAKINPETAEMEKVDLPTSYNFVAAVYDGENIWFADSGKLLVKFNPENYEVEEYELPVATSSKSLLYATDSNSIWVIHRFGYQIIKVDLAKMGMEVLEVDSTQEDLSVSSDVCLSATTDGHYIWLAPSCFATVIQIDSQTNEFTYIPIEGEDLGTAEEPYPGSRVYSRFGSCGYDGKYVWFFPYAVNRIIRMDAQTHEFIGYDTSEGEDLGSVPSSIAKFWGSCFDGKNFWLMPGQADRLVKLESIGNPVSVNSKKTEANSEKSKKGCSGKKGCGVKNIFNLYQSCQPPEVFCQPKRGCHNSCS